MGTIIIPILIQLWPQKVSRLSEVTQLLGGTASFALESMLLTIPPCYVRVTVPPQNES